MMRARSRGDNIAGDMPSPLQCSEKRSCGVLAGRHSHWHRAVTVHGRTGTLCRASLDPCGSSGAAARQARGGPAAAMAPDEPHGSKPQAMDLACRFLTVTIASAMLVRGSTQAAAAPWGACHDLTRTDRLLLRRHVRRCRQ
jgi:hypothetical protein